MMRLHLNNMRQGPGSDDATNLALNLAGIDRSKFYRVADIGCGTGAQTIALAASLKGEIVAVDLFEEFLAKLEKSCSGRALGASVSTVVASMDDLPFEREEFDIVWSEGAVYNMGFRKGVNYWKDFIEDGGILAVTELSSTTISKPSGCLSHFLQASATALPPPCQRSFPAFLSCTRPSPAGSSHVFRITAMNKPSPDVRPGRKR